MKKEIPNLELVNEKTGKLNSFEVLKIEYKQKDEKGKVYKNLMIILPTKNQTFYLVFRSLEADFKKLESDIEKITSDFAAYLESLKL